MKTWLSALALAVVFAWRIALRRRRTPFDPETYPRMRDIHGVVHFAYSLADPLGYVACGYHSRHPFEEVNGMALPGQRVDGIACRECVKMIRPDL